MNFATKCLVVTLFTISAIVSVKAQEENTQPANNPGFIVDELSIFMHAGPGTRFRILGSVTAGSSIDILPESEDDYQKIIDNRGRTGWVEQKYVTKDSSLRTVVAELNAQLASTSETESQLKSQVSEQATTIALLESDNSELNSKIAKLTKQLDEQEQLLSTQDMQVKKEWFYTGGIVLGIGLLLGLIIPKLAGGRRRTQMSSWS